MKNVTRIVVLALCLLLASTSCRRKHYDPVEPPQNIPIGFSAVSQTSTVKSPTKATTYLSDFHQDFGVWGIARHSSSTIQPYVLWGEDELSEVYAEENEESVSDEDKYTGVFIPREDAYWLVGYTYNFLAIAPYDSGAANLEIDQDNNQISFTYDLGAKYALSDYDFDLMAAASETEVTSSRTAELTFWHLFSKININISFVDASNNPARGLVSKMRLCKVGSKAAYTLSFKNDKTLNVECATPIEQRNLVFDNGNCTVHILPQTITGLELYLDFERDDISYQDFKVNLNATGTNPTQYNYNEVYNWNITIGPKNAISFSVGVDQWSSDKVNDTDIEII